MATQLILPDYLPKGFSRYVSGAAFTGQIHRGQLLRANLGAPATLDADGIYNNLSTATAGTFTTFETTYSAVNGLSGRYGRNVTMVCSGAATSTVRVRGYDYLGQAMSELFTLNGTTTVQGVKAFKYISAVVIVTTTASETIDVGWGDRLGLPFKALRALAAYEDGAMKTFGSEMQAVTTAGVQAGAGTTAATLTVPFDGWYCGSTFDVTTAQATTAAVIDFIYDGTGTAALDIPVPATQAIGEVGGELKAAADWLAVVGGRTITLTSDGAGDTGVVTVHSWFSRGKSGAAFQAPVDTDPQTQTTRDPRGLYIPATACDGAIVHEVEIYPDFDFTYGVAHNFA